MKDVVLFPNELGIVYMLGEKFGVDNWFMSDRLDKDKRTLSQCLTKLRDSNLLEGKKKGLPFFNGSTAVNSVL